ncbi:hypothetical protein L917_07451 [Phytophthora nicotianae]|nr:hypothetical protein L917_07451 [Phytophthora nicotianae]
MYYSVYLRLAGTECERMGTMKKITIIKPGPEILVSPSVHESQFTTKRTSAEQLVYSDKFSRFACRNERNQIKTA